MSAAIIKAQTLTSNQTLAGTGVDLGEGWNKVFLEIPAITSGSTRVQACETLAGTYRHVAIAPVTSLVADDHYTIKSTITSCIVEVAMPGYRYAKVESTSGSTDAESVYKFITTF